KQHCDDFIEWIPYSNINIDKNPIAKGHNSKVFIGKWEESINIVLKVLKESKNFKSEFLNEFNIHYKCLGKCAIPFYGLTEHMQGYAMVLKRAIHGDLRMYINKNKLTWPNKIEILSSIAKSLHRLHELNIIHRDFHCGNILIDDDAKVFISDFGISRSDGSIIGVLPYIAPEILSGKQYTKKSDIYSFGIIMWDLTSTHRPFWDRPYDTSLALEIICKDLRPEVVEGTPEVYKNTMKKCWDSDPLERPDSSDLIELIDDMIKLPCIITSRPRAPEQVNNPIEDCSFYLPKTTQFDPNVWSTAILIWFNRYVLVDYRSEWAGRYQKASDWLCQQVKDKKVRDELLEAARIFVVKRFEVEKDAIEKDESFKDSLEAKDRYHDRGVADEEPHDFMIPSDEVVGIIRICVKSAKDLKKSDFWFTFSNPDPYVRIMNAAGAEIVRTRVNHGTVNPKWDEIHFVSVHGSGEKISVEIFDENLFIADRPLGTYVLDTNTLMKNEDHSKAINEWFPLEIGNKPAKGQLNLEVRFIPTAFTEGVDFKFTRESIKLNHIYMLISWRKANGSFEFTEKLARFFNYNSVDELKEDFLKHISSDQELLKCDLSILSTALTIMYLKVLCWKHYSEWKQIISNSEVWVSKEINDINIEDRLYDLCRTFMIERFKVKDFEKEQMEIITPVKHTIITRKVVTVRHIRTLTNHQDDDGCVVLNEKVAEYYGFKNTNLENEIMECAKKFVVDRYDVDKEAIAADNSFIAAVKTKDEAIKQEKISEKRRLTGMFDDLNKQISLSGTKVTRKTTTDELVKKFITYRTKDGGFKITDELAQHLGFLNKESLEIALRSHFISDDLAKLPSEILATACDDLHKWLSLQIKNPQIERELLGSAKDFVITRYNIDDEVIGLDTPYQDIESAKSIIIDNKDKAFERKIADAVVKN
ncbi:8050_t:CDS:2, partial [Racocetra fulgida]